MRLLAIVLSCALAACSTANISLHGGGSGTSGAIPGTGSVSGSVGVNIQGSSAGGAVLTVAAIAALLGIWRAAPGAHAAPALLEDRAIVEADCTQPIADWSANLRCR